MKANSWKSFSELFFFDPTTEFSLDVSRLVGTSEDLARFESPMSRAFEQMKALESGAIANPDEKRMVGHYWLRAPELAPTREISSLISTTVESVLSFTSAVQQGKLVAPSGKKFRSMLIIGIGGSALGPQLVNGALGSPGRDGLAFFIFDNTDPDGMARVLDSIPSLDETLCVVISKSGGTKETKNGQLVARAAFEAKNLSFAKHAVAITGEGSDLDKQAKADGFIATFPMWDWVGGRTSELSAVGLLPAALQGFKIQQLLDGAKHMDALTRAANIKSNPAALLAVSWFIAGDGRGAKDMVILPYKDRLELMSRYLQQLVMESLGKERDLDGKVVHQGIAVYGNKGSTDQHAYVQQLRDGLNNFFAVFIEVLKDTSSVSSSNAAALAALNVEPSITAGDYLSGFYLGTREALAQSGRASITLTVKEVNEFTVGMLIALFERAVGLYATLVNVNAYHQPGVEAGKKAAARVLELQSKIERVLSSSPASATTIAAAIGASDDAETVFKIAMRLSANGRAKRTLKQPLTDSLFAKV